MSGGFAVFQLLLREMWLILEEWGCFDMGVCYLVFRKRHRMLFNFQSFLSLSGMPLDFRWWEHLQKVAEGTQHWPLWGWFSGVWCFQVPMKEESWFCWQRYDFSNVGFQESGLPGVDKGLSLLDPCCLIAPFCLLVSWFVVYTCLSFWWTLKARASAPLWLSVWLLSWLQGGNIWDAFVRLIHQPCKFCAALQIMWA